MALYSVQEISNTLTNATNLKKWSVKDGRKVIATSEQYGEDPVIAWSECVNELKPGTYSIEFKISEIPCVRQFSIESDSKISGMPHSAHLTLGYNKDLEDKFNLISTLRYEKMVAEYQRDDYRKQLDAALSRIQQLEADGDDDDETETENKEDRLLKVIEGIGGLFKPTAAVQPVQPAQVQVAAAVIGNTESQNDLKTALVRLKQRFPEKPVSKIINFFVDFSQVPFWKSKIDEKVKNL